MFVYREEAVEDVDEESPDTSRLTSNDSLGGMIAQRAHDSVSVAFEDAVEDRQPRAKKIPVLRPTRKTVSECKARRQGR